MEPLLDVISVFAACGDLSVDVVMGEMYPTVTVRQGPGLHLCTSAMWAAAPYLAAGAVPLALLSRLAHARPRRRVR